MRTRKRARARAVAVVIRRTSTRTHRGGNNAHQVGAQGGEVDKKKKKCIKRTYVSRLQHYV